MDPRLPLGAPDAGTLARLLEKERERGEALAQELARLRAGLARQNATILRLEQRDAARQEELATQRLLVAGLTEQNSRLRQQVAQLEQENAQLRGTLPGRVPEPEPESRPASQAREPRTRKQRGAEHNRGRQRMPHATHWETHAVENCPQCGEALAGGWIVRRVQVIDLPAQAPLEITEHRIIRRPDRREWIPAVEAGLAPHRSVSRHDASDGAASGHDS